MSNTRFAKVHDGLIVRKGDARPAIAPSVPGISFVDETPSAESALKTAREQIARPLQLVSEEEARFRFAATDRHRDSIMVTDEALYEHAASLQAYQEPVKPEPKPAARQISVPETEKSAMPFSRQTAEPVRVEGSSRPSETNTADSTSTSGNLTLEDVATSVLNSGIPGDAAAMQEPFAPKPSELLREGPATREEARATRPPKRREVLDVPLTHKEFEDLCNGTCSLPDEHPLPPGKYRFVIRLDADQRRRVRILAAKKNVSNQDVITMAIDHYLNEIASGPMKRCGCMQAINQGS